MFGVLTTVMPLCEAHAEDEQCQPCYIDLVYNYNDLNEHVYSAYAGKDREREHQIGRFINFKDILSKCQRLEGDIIEFGTHKGFSLMWIAHIAEMQKLYSKQIIGIDGFVGLPYDDGGFRMGDFTTSLNQCLVNIAFNKQCYEVNYKNISIGKYLFSQKDEIFNFLEGKNLKKFCFIHLDCDVSQSALEVFDILVEGNYIADKAFVVFDDYYCESALSHTVEVLFEKLDKDWEIHPYSRTHLTQTFQFTKR